MAEAIENNVRKLIINESPVDPAYYEKMSKLLDALIEQRRKGVVTYVEYLQKIAKLAKQATIPGGDGPGYPSTINTPALRALFNNLKGYAPDLALAVDQAIKFNLQAGWRDNSMKVKKVRFAIRDVLATVTSLDLDSETDRILELAKQQHHDY